MRSWVNIVTKLVSTVAEIKEFLFPVYYQFTICILLARWLSNPKCWCVLEFRETNSVQLCSKSILEWFNDFIERECICDQGKGHSGRSTVPENVVETIICVAPRSRHADVAKTHNFRNAQYARSYANA
ncbi:hypothetical protein PoB_005881400 [Plakobranchus ocellatus]|uniref:Uncharacterized protein n=1 Tax=Plakobranchus ocellatus TaxID=259542 RepID=A0AAV4CMC6_9GAST|nr:hypothetical protein PoB_005881400 [Plakobranchus ocellatus]